MRERLDCALLCTDYDADRIGQYHGVHAGGRLHLQVFDSTIDSTDTESVHVLANACMRLQRFDACLVPVSPPNLGWIRMALSSAGGILQTPVVALVSDLKASALHDLFSLGLADFIRDPICMEELRARIERLLGTRRYNVSSPGVGCQALVDAANQYRQSTELALLDEEAMHQSILDRSGAELEAFAIASASRSATTKESFRAAKGRVIERFERAYIKAALGRHSGNIAMAARSAQKHRRAFWALMRKHNIDAAPYRCESSPNFPVDG
ncbi:hypothetical protein LKR43_13185 [Pusillimonas sp. MFBS29]|uniref:hypothetical protein n=1 Tax=Pusillimonas sp. MFBS29 TaxID=2886690 RepID=UPI001D10A0B5|nr:hypothetical protein [Pusillimonas sp. MFBS29]MCC2597291.1 hypothetical protein [Pusillimonas sp. MFBS29]